MKLENKVAVITGGASGLGCRTAEYFVREKGARVAVFDVSDEAGADLAAQIGGDRLIHCRVDVADEQQVAQGVARTVERFGAIHVCVNCAGVPAPLRIIDKDLTPTSGPRFARAVAVNLVGTFNVMAHCVAQMARNPPENGEERGVVINVASGAAFEGQAGQAAYASSKAGVVGLSLPAARELSSLGIRVNAIAPGLFDTAMAQALSPKILDGLKALIEFPKRPGDMSEFASLCAYMCENSYINGECIRLDGAARLPARLDPVEALRTE